MPPGREGSAVSGFGPGGLAGGRRDRAGIGMQRAGGGQRYRHVTGPAPVRRAPGNRGGCLSGAVGCSGGTVDLELERLFRARGPGAVFREPIRHRGPDGGRQFGTTDPSPAVRARPLRSDRGRRQVDPPPDRPPVARRAGPFQAAGDLPSLPPVSLPVLRPRQPPFRALSLGHHGPGLPKGPGHAGRGELERALGGSLQGPDGDPG